MNTNNDDLNEKQCDCGKDKLINDLLKRISNLEFEVEDKDRENERLNNIINELEKWLEERTYGMNEIHTYKIGALEDEVILNKLKALKENNK